MRLIAEDESASTFTGGLLGLVLTTLLTASAA